MFHVVRYLTEEEPVWAYALLHDVGHAPFSHLSEIVLREMGHGYDHERMGREVAREILQDSVFTVQEVFGNPLAVLVDGGVGADRIDYLQRDSFYTGVKIGYLEWDRLVRNMWVEGRRLVVSQKVLPTVEHLYIARFIMGDSVYYHKTQLVADELFKRALLDLLEHYSPREIVRMDDVSLISALRRMRSPWWRRIEARRLFKMVYRGSEDGAREVYEDYSSRYGEESVVLGRRGTFYSEPDVYLESGESILQVSPLLRALRDSEEERVYWFVAVDPTKIPLP